MMGIVYDDNKDAALHLKVGDKLTFGTFVPSIDSFSIDIRFPIFWHVTAREGNVLKLLSDYFFDHTGYWSSSGSIGATWKNTEIRFNLNNRCFNDYFSETEQAAILTTEVKTQKSDSSIVVTRDKLYVP